LTLTDLPSAIKLLQDNLIGCGIENGDDTDSEDEYEARQQETKKSSKDREFKESSIKELEWQDNKSNLPDWLCNSIWDVVIVTDCTYNPDNYLKLLTTLSAIADSNSKAIILYASKYRHESESKFDDLLKQHGFIVKQSWKDTHLMSKDIIEINTIIRRSPDGSNWGIRPPGWIPFHPLEGFWWSPDEVLADPSRKGWLRTLLDKRSLLPADEVNEMIGLGRRDIMSN
jgi:hypothetical protein